MCNIISVSVPSSFLPTAINISTHTHPSHYHRRLLDKAVSRRQLRKGILSCLFFLLRSAHHHHTIHPSIRAYTYFSFISTSLFAFAFAFPFWLTCAFSFLFAIIVFDWFWVLVLSNFLCFSSFLHLAPPTSFPLCLSAYILSFDLFRCSFIHSFAVHVVYCISIFFAFRSRPHSPFHPDILASTLT